MDFKCIFGGIFANQQSNHKRFEQTINSIQSKYAVWEPFQIRFLDLSCQLAECQTCSKEVYMLQTWRSCFFSLLNYLREERKKGGGGELGKKKGKMKKDT